MKKQKEDIEELASMFKDMLGKNPQPQDAFMKDFQRHFTPQHDFAAQMCIRDRLLIGREGYFYECRDKHFYEWLEKTGHQAVAVSYTHLAL